MKNPWIRKNPLLSMWLSAANAAAGSARGRTSAAMKRESTAMMRRATRQMTELWTDALAPAKPRRKKRR
ncbi:MAG TPA: hypothetical protein VGE12_05705 [Noviherbaspirillum sp.]